MRLTRDRPSGAKSDDAKGGGGHKWGQNDAHGRTSDTHEEREEIYVEALSIFTGTKVAPLTRHCGRGRGLFSIYERNAWVKGLVRGSGLGQVICFAVFFFSRKLTIIKIATGKPSKQPNKETYCNICLASLPHIYYSTVFKSQ